MRQIYELAPGDTFSICGHYETFIGQYQVEKVVEQVAICTGKDHPVRLMLPLFVPMPFAVLVGERPAPAKAEKPAPVAAAEPAPAEETPEPTPETAAAEPVRKEGVIDYFNAMGHWGKIAHEKYGKGLFFHLSMVEDEALKARLDALKMGDKLPKLTVSYEEMKNPRKINALCAGHVRLEAVEEAPEEPTAPEEPPVPCTGYITSYGGGKGVIMVRDVDDRVHFTDADVDDAALLDQLKNVLAPGTVDSADIKVAFLRAGRKAQQVTWLRGEPEATEDIPEAEVEAAEEVPEAKAEAAEPTAEPVVETVSEPAPENE